uniref:regulator of G-protein signaling 17-like n=1 Tax=Myxine glutinosa TaxID=7769 RepID=UPI00358E67CB
MGKRQTAQNDNGASAPPHSPACCFCWCCCCSCSCLTVGNDDSSKKRRKTSCEHMEMLQNRDDSVVPTITEALSWAQSFDKLIRSATGRNVFREFLRSEYSEENLLFWLACEDLKEEVSKVAIEEKARIIYEDYISILSPKEVSLDSRVREVINRSMTEPTPQAFDDAQMQIYTLMHRDSYPRFLSSPVYKALLTSLQEPIAES